jgi:hypothetical protein
MSGRSCGCGGCRRSISFTPVTIRSIGLMLWRPTFARSLSVTGNASSPMNSLRVGLPRAGLAVRLRSWTRRCSSSSSRAGFGGRDRISGAAICHCRASMSSPDRLTSRALCVSRHHQHRVRRCGSCCDLCSGVRCHAVAWLGLGRAVVAGVVLEVVEIECIRLPAYSSLLSGQAGIARPRFMSTAGSGASCCVLFHSESCAGSNQICGISTRVSTAKRIAAKSTRRSRSRRQHGRQAASSTGGCESGVSGSAEYAAQTVANGGSSRLIFVQ